MIEEGKNAEEEQNMTMSRNTIIRECGKQQRGTKDQRRTKAESEETGLELVQQVQEENKM
jgi:hypothetical protein